MANVMDADDISSTITHIRQRIAANQPANTDAKERNINALQRLHTVAVGRDATQPEIDAA